MSKNKDKMYSNKVIQNKPLVNYFMLSIKKNRKTELKNQLHFLIILNINKILTKICL